MVIVPLLVYILLKKALRPRWINIIFHSFLSNVLGVQAKSKQKSISSIDEKLVCSGCLGLNIRSGFYKHAYYLNLLRIHFDPVSKKKSSKTLAFNFPFSQNSLSSINHINQPTLLIINIWFLQSKWKINYQNIGLKSKWGITYLLNVLLYALNSLISC